jgi:hypothetical protein
VDEVPHDPRWVQLRPRPHPLPFGHLLEAQPGAEHVGVVTRESGPTVDRFRLTVPPGTTEIILPVAGEVSAKLDGSDVPVLEGRIRVARPTRGGAELKIRVAHDGHAEGGRLWSGPAVLRAERSGPIGVGEWSAQGLGDYSGAVRYRTRVRGPVAGASLDLGQVRGTAEVTVNGRPAGCRIWSPYAFDVSGLLDLVDNVIEIDVHNTLAPYIDAVSASPWVLPGQTVSGLIGPVVLRTAQEEGT